MSQPFYLATLEDPSGISKQIIINENQVSTIEPGPKGTAIVKMSNGDTLVTLDPDYEAWVADVIVRKY